MACLFCEIVAGRIPAKVVQQDDQVLAFHDIDPKAPTHVLVIPKRHITSLLDLSPEDDALMELVTKKLVAPDEAYAKSVDKGGFEALLKRAGLSAAPKVASPV